MIASVKFDKTNAFKKLKSHHKTISKSKIKDLFEADKNRHSKFTLKFTDFVIDYSKNNITGRTMSYLNDLAVECKLEEAIQAMFAGEKINVTEGRAVLHTALRNRSNTPVIVDGKDVMPDINAVLAQMKTFSEQVRSGEWKGYTGKKIKDIVSDDYLSFYYRLLAY